MCTESLLKTSFCLNCMFLQRKMLLWGFRSRKKIPSQIIWNLAYFLISIPKWRESLCTTFLWDCLLLSFYIIDSSLSGSDIYVHIGAYTYTWNERISPVLWDLKSFEILVFNFAYSFWQIELQRVHIIGMEIFYLNGFLSPILQWNHSIRTKNESEFNSCLLYNHKYIVKCKIHKFNCVLPRKVYVSNLKLIDFKYVSP